MKLIPLLCLILGSLGVWAQEVNIYHITLKEQQDSSLLIDHGIWVNQSFIMSDHDGKVFIKTSLNSVNILIEGATSDTTIFQPGEHVLYCDQTHELEMFEVHHEELEPNHIHQEVNSTDIATALQTQQEVAIINTGPQVKKPMYLVFAGSDLLITQRNTRLNGQDWGMDHAPEMDFSSLESLEYLGDVQKFMYTLKPGGVILTQGSHPKFHQKLHLKWSTVFNANPKGGNSALTFSSGFKKGFLKNFAWEARGSGVYQANGYAPNYVLSNTARNGYNYGGSLFFHLHQVKINIHYDLYQNKIGLPSFAHVGNLTDLENSYRRGNPINPQDNGFQTLNFYQDILHETVNLELKYNPQKNHLILLNASRQFDQRKEYDEDIDPELDLRLSSYVINTTWKHFLPKGTFVLGGEYIFKNNTYKGRYFIPFYKDHEFALFSYKDWRKNRHLFRLGGRIRNNIQRSYPRAQNFEATSITNWSYAGGIDYEFKSGKHFFQNNLSYQSYAPNLIQLYSSGIHHGAQAYEEGNLDLNNQELLLLKSEHHWNISQKFTLKYGVQGGYFFNTINLRPEGKSILTISGAYPVWSYVNEAAYLYGVKVKSIWKFTKTLKWEMQGQYLVSKNSDGIAFPFTPPLQINQALIYEWQILEKHRIICDVNWQYFGNSQVTTQLNDFRLTPHDYSLFNLGINYKYHLKNDGHLYFGINIQNILNQAYRNNLNRLHPFSVELGRNIQINIKIEI